MKAIKEESLKEIIYKSVLQGIFDCEYRPAQVLTEKELMQRYGCSKSPVREALVALCNDNVLRNIPRYGYEVIRITQDDVNDMMHFRYILEGGALKANLKNITAKQVEKLESIDLTCQVASDVWTHWEANCAFHLQIMAFYRNECCYSELKRILAHLKCAYAQFYWSRWSEDTVVTDTKSHADLINAIKEKDEQRALKALVADLQDFGNMKCEIENILA